MDEERTETEQTGEDMTGAEISVQKSASPEENDRSRDLYVYDVQDDEPVTDRDLYYDYDTSAANVKAEPVPSEKKEEKPAPAVKPETKTGPVTVKAPEAAHPVSIPEDELRRVAERGNVDMTTSGNVKVNKIYMLNTVISMITLCLTAAAIFTGYAYIHSVEQELDLHKRTMEQEKKEKEESEKETDEDEGDIIEAISIIDEEKTDPALSVSETVEIENGKLLLYDSYVGYSWAPVLSGVKANTYDRKAFRLNSQGRMEYIQNGEISSYFGIDVSSHQGDIDWNAARADGVEFAILRIGVRGYGEEGNIKADDMFVQNYDGAHDAGVDLGVYFYSQAISVTEAEEEAKFVLEQLDGRALEYPVVFDWEPVDQGSAETTPRTEDVMPSTLTLAAVAFCETIKDAGYDAMIYTNKKMAYIKYDMRRLTDYPVWIASYSDELTYYYDFDIWQYGYGKVDGIEGDVDLDIGMIR